MTTSEENKFQTQKIAKRDQENKGREAEFRSLLINKCQREFEENNSKHTKLSSLIEELNKSSVITTIVYIPAFISIYTYA